jgi:hypothetical protein
MEKTMREQGAVFLLVGLVSLVSASALGADFYYVSNEGSDTNEGRSPDSPWRTIARVNAPRYAPGSCVLFRRGDSWRERLEPRGGNGNGYVTYSAYGTGDKPVLMGSVERNDPTAWTDEGGNLWSSVLADCPHSDRLRCDVGNIIFNNGESCGVKVWNESDLDAQGEFWHDEAARTLKMYSVANPAEVYADVECALRSSIIGQSDAAYVVYEDLALRYGGAHGIGGGNTHHIIVRNCDFSFIGGGDQYGGDETVRYGNAVEFWSNAHDNLVEGCRFWEVYDAAMTNQNNDSSVQQYNIVYRNNLVWNCEYSFEYWNWPDSSSTKNIRFENNTCVNAGGGWGHTQRPDPSGRHLCFYESPASAQGIVIRNNIFFEARGNAFYAPRWPKASVDALDMDGNCWFQSDGQMVLLEDRGYSMAEFPEYQAEWDKEPNSIARNPQLADISSLDLRLQATSPCIDAGTVTGVLADFEGSPRPVDIPGLGRDGTCDAFDIGAYEYQSGGIPPCTPTPTPTLTPTASPTATMHPGSDVDRDGEVGALDLFMLLRDWMRVSGVFCGTRTLGAVR